ncbi:unnamed protein product [Parascedosporium putredinis]|uniref:Amidohydrolase 3 domain-containing protein n=1 Tax=Parascedosporium putredinis TaxID=1442378 RepID=A0A9P1H0P1_9PEZI|nr:unnamed protein product [Parascedosporium putredinis]CAI7991924.1 unnamed protein product [Parascedosporium putredinis]
MKNHPAPSRFMSLEELRPLRRRPRRRSRELRALGLACLLLISYVQWRLYTETSSSRSPDITAHGLFIARLEEDLETCTKLHTKPTDPIGLGREKSARYVDGKPPTLIINATADVYLQHGLIKRLEERIPLDSLPKDTLVYDAKGRPLTSGIIDMHSHVGVHSLPTIHSNDDTSELSSDITPTNNIGGEAYVVKHAVGATDGRNETSVQDMLADPGRA